MGDADSVGKIRTRKLHFGIFYKNHVLINGLPFSGSGCVSISDKDDGAARNSVCKDTITFKRKQRAHKHGR
jgi:hypothetical protein